jgi:hypothetical protein
MVHPGTAARRRHRSGSRWPLHRRRRHGRLSAGLPPPRRQIRRAYRERRQPQHPSRARPAAGHQTAASAQPVSHTYLKAALNLPGATAWYQATMPGGGSSRSARWRPRLVRYLSADDIARLRNATAGGFRDLVHLALLTGCRYGELTVNWSRTRFSEKDKCDKSSGVITGDWGMTWLKAGRRKNLKSNSSERPEKQAAEKQG